MRRKSPIAWTLILSSLMLTVVGSTARSAGPSYRPFVPVQKGPSKNVQRVQTYRPGRVMIRLSAAALRASRIPATAGPRDPLPGAITGLPNLDRVLAGVGARSMRRAWDKPIRGATATALGVDRWFSVDYQGTLSASVVADRLRNLGEVEQTSLDYVAFPAAVPADPLYPIHWGHHNTAQMLSYNWGAGSHEAGSPVGLPGFDCNAEQAWDASQGFGSSSVIIAIIDTGVEVGHPDLRQVTGYDFGDNDSNPDDDSAEAGHGTACSGVAAGINNLLGSAGAAPGCSIMPLKVANSSGAMSFSAIQNALYYAADHGASIISMSLGADIANDPATDTAIQYAYNAGCVILAATGNSNYSTISYPANHANVIGVGAASPCGERKRSSSDFGEVNPGVDPDVNGYTCDGERWWGSNYGGMVQDAPGAVDVIAPTILPTADLLGGAGYDASDYSKWFNGTSCATPYAAGVCALIKSANPSWNPAQIRNRLVQTAQDVISVESPAGWDRYAGYGMVDAAAAVGGTPPPPTDQIVVLSPNGGNILVAGSIEPIYWSWSGSFTLVDIDYSTNGGVTWSNVVSGTDNDGAFSWTVPFTPTGQARIRISGGSVSDISDASFTIMVPGGSYATLPYFTDFEDGSLDSHWSTSTTGDGRVRVLPYYGPYDGSYHLVMDDATSGGFSRTEASLHLDMTGRQQVAMSFWWKDFNDETQQPDGIYFSNDGGATFAKVYDLLPGSYSDDNWRLMTLDVDALAASRGLSLSPTFVIKFVQYDDSPVSTDGMAFDNVHVYIPEQTAITSESESNNVWDNWDGPLGSGVDVRGRIDPAGDEDWFSLDVGATGYITISLSIGNHEDLDWFLYDSYLNEVKRGYGIVNPEVDSYYASPGHYYLMVNGYRGDTAPYVLRVTGELVTSVLTQVDKPVPIEPSVVGLLQNAPNPFRDRTSIAFTLPSPGDVRLEVFDLGGRRVARLAEGSYEAGSHRIEWDGRTTSGERVPAGLYFYRLTTPGSVETRKLMILD